ncbi:hypothetical protein DNTS_018096 [Danionella cerebrum]|uniref:Transmembrane protein 17B n=1 Tax=Danionella cerebrum TaxID=2873325 RepID=A0A553MZH2_9TELE|nr:hypothetical protein DNTS_018096 [Danionella translucida]
MTRILPLSSQSSVKLHKFTTRHLEIIHPAAIATALIETRFRCYGTASHSLAFVMDLPEGVRRRLGNFSRTVFVDQTRSQTLFVENAIFTSQNKDVISSLPLQMSLYFNVQFFPFWWICEVVMLQLKLMLATRLWSGAECTYYAALADYYKFILITILILMTLIEAIRLYLGNVGNLQEKVPELAGFWLLTLLLQFPLILFQLFNQALLVQPLERAVHIILALFIFSEVCIHLSFSEQCVGPSEDQGACPLKPIILNMTEERYNAYALFGFNALRAMVRHTESRFHLRQFQELRM